MRQVANTNVSSLTDRLRERIARTGPITFHDWMQVALYDEHDGYYCRRGRIRQGRKGDYRTAPETSPLFAATFAHYFMKSYFDLAAPEHWTIVEVGGGAGDFAVGVLTTLQHDFPNVFAATNYVIDEISADAQSRTLTEIAQFKDRVRFQSLSEINEPWPYAIIFSNELIDAFPVHRVIGRNGGLRELFVASDAADNFVLIEDDPDAAVADYCARINLQLAEGQIYEVNLSAETHVSRVASLIEQGLLIIVDYGARRAELISDPNRFKGTLRAFHKHQVVDDLLARPGESDLTTTIDWTQIIEAGERNGFETLRFQRLDQFVAGEGIDALMNLSGRITDPTSFFNLNAGARELIMPNGMAASFQVLVQQKTS